MKEYTSRLNLTLDVVFSAERSIEDEINRESGADVMTIITSYLIMFAYVAIALGKLGNCSLSGLLVNVWQIAEVVVGALFLESFFRTSLALLDAVFRLICTSFSLFWDFLLLNQFYSWFHFLSFPAVCVLTVFVHVVKGHGTPYYFKDKNVPNYKN